MNPMRPRWLPVLAILLTAAFSFAPAQAQTAEESQAKPVGTPVPLKVTVVIGRYQGEKRTSNLPFVLNVNTDGQAATLQIGADVPYAQTALIGGSPTQSYSYRAIGTNITCSAQPLEDGRFRLRLSVSDSQIFSDALQSTKPVSFQTFRSEAWVILRDGQTTLYNTAVDKASGEAIRLEVTLNVIK